jgi:glycerol-3-phosphate acyltransferase PlsY
MLSGNPVSSILPSLALGLLSFLCGSLPFSVWLGKLLGRTDVRGFGDGNPGAANAFHAAGPLVGLLVLLLDVGKSAVPVGLVYHNLGYRGLPVWLVATSAVLGHAFSPFLSFRGGKGLAVALGVWIGLTLWRISLPAVLLILLWTALLDVNGWAVMLTLAGMLAVLAIWVPDLMLLAVLAGQVVILAWTHRADLRRRPHLRPWLARRSSR